MEYVWLILVAPVLIWFVYNHLTRFERAAKEMERVFRQIEKSDDSGLEFKPIPVGYKVHRTYSEWEDEARKIGFEKLGDIYTEQQLNGSMQDDLIRVMVNRNGNTILAFTRFIIGARIVEQTEMVSWYEDGHFAYSTNNNLVYSLKSPSKILLNKVDDKNLANFKLSHERFLEANNRGALKKYESIESVMAGMTIQGELRREFNKSKEFPIDEEEANALTNKVNAKANKRIYEILRAIRANAN